MRRPPDLTALTAALVLLASPAAGQEGASATCPEPEARAFDFWLGEWDVLNRNRSPDGERFGVTGRATDRVYAVVDGCGVVEHWRGDGFVDLIAGYSLRAWNPASREWDLVLLWPIGGAPRFGELHGGFEDGVGRFYVTNVSAAGDTVVTRFTFDEVTPTSLRWSNGNSTDGGATWSEPTWIMEFTRRDPIRDHGLWNGLGSGTGRCPGEPHRTYDEALGEWNGTRFDATGDSTPVRARIVRTLEGCAVMHAIEAVDGSWKVHGIGAWETAREGWTAYDLDTRERTIRRWASAPGASPFELTARGDADRRTRWVFEGDEVRIVEERRTAGAWTAVNRIVLERELSPPPGR